MPFSPIHVFYATTVLMTVIAAMMGMAVASIEKSEDYDVAYKKFEITGYIVLSLIVLVIIRRLAQKVFADYFAGTQATDIEFENI